VEAKEALLREIFYLIRHTSQTFEDSILLPVPVRRYFVESVVEDLKGELKEKEAFSKSLQYRK